MIPKYRNQEREKDVFADSRREAHSTVQLLPGAPNDDLDDKQYLIGYSESVWRCLEVFVGEIIK